MDWDSWSTTYKDLGKSGKKLLRWEYDILPLFPLLVGSFGGAAPEKLRFFPLLCLALVLFFGRTALSLFAQMRERQGLPVTTRKYFLEATDFPFEENTLRFWGYVSTILTLICGLVLCIACGFGLLTFGILYLATVACYFLNLCQRYRGLDMVLAFANSFFLTAAAYMTQAGSFAWTALALSLPMGFIAPLLLLYQKEGDAMEKGSSFFYEILGEEKEKSLITLCFTIAYAFVVINVLYGVSGFWCLLLLALIPLAKKGFPTEKALFSFYLKFGFLYGFCLLLRLTFAA